MMIQFFKFPLLFSGGIQLNLEPTSTVCFVWKMTLNKKSFRCTRCDLRVHNKCNNTLFFDSDICSDCRWENGGGVACYIKNNIAHNRQSSISKNIENIVLDILLPKLKPITLGIIHRPPNQEYFINHFNNAVGKLLFQSNEVYLLRGFNINLLFEGH